MSIYMRDLGLFLGGKDEGNFGPFPKRKGRDGRSGSIYSSSSAMWPHLAAPKVRAWQLESYDLRGTGRRGQRRRSVLHAPPHVCYRFSSILFTPGKGKWVRSGDWKNGLIAI
ncbi:hypothetical protein KY290_033293 [Solanum tuberosum]|uniref:Uncharacterized protein n=1 Tax=Solanum tuberosum TaxID=4113 RepID=A0ABQ7U0G4_SOLTU|nr:hypothetical protein KY289_032667 [Solanum tuberosum]KAH0647307.1 hypothetical protein KY285_032555 [Solanum tuberosum]KAH0740250.1 hypothetical protein KY290_033293 [Solanum tuberosum]